MYTRIAFLSAIFALVVFVGRRFDALSRLSTVSLELMRPNTTIFRYLLFSQAYLLMRYPIKSADGKESLPTLSFVWPNGQGNIEKYLRGRENSSKWGAQCGSLYRIWSGFHGEMQETPP